MDHILYWGNRLHAFIAYQLYCIPKQKKAPGALKAGLLSTTTLDPCSFVYPASISPDVVLYAVACSDVKASQTLAKLHGFHKPYDSYDALLSDPEIDFVYIALPAHLHFRWVSKALEAGKHVLVDKPVALNGLEASELADQERRTGKCLMEASHSQFHPSIYRLKEILSSGELGKVLQVDVSGSSNTFGRRDSRWQYQSGGGSLLLNSELIGLYHFVLDTESPEEVLWARATTTLHDPRVDADMKAQLRYNYRGDDLICNISTTLPMKWIYRIIPRIWNLPTIKVTTEKAQVVFYNVAFPHLLHYIAIKSKATGKWSYQWIYRGGVLWKERGGFLWSSHRYQLEAFVDKLKGRNSMLYANTERSSTTLKVVDEIYRKAGLPIRQST